jgi:hypothetical protein
MFGKVRISLDQNGLVAALEKMAGAPVAPVVFGLATSKAFSDCR